MSVRTKSKSGLFLIELILAILFFAVASAVCVQIFVSSHMISEKSSSTSMAVVVSSSAAETLKATGGSAEKMSSLLGASVTKLDDGAQVLTVSYDKKWNKLPSSEDTAAYQMTVKIKTDETFATGDISVFATKKPESPILQFDVKKFLG